MLTNCKLWYLIRCDRIAELLIQRTVQTADGTGSAFPIMAFSGAVPFTTEQLLYAELIDPSDAFFWDVTFSATESPRYDWLNHAVTLTTYHYALH